VTGVVFFNNVGFLGMCVHGTIGLVVTLAHLGRIAPGVHAIDTPVGVVTATLHDDGEVSVRNVPSRRAAHRVPLRVPGMGTIHGDIAWGGNWFFLVDDHGQRIAFDNVERLTDATWRIRQALEAAGITGDDGGEIDHIELFGPSSRADSRNFVLCPGRQYDRSPCGTGTSAKLACLHAGGKLAPGQVWRQESIIGSIFTGTVEACEGGAAREGQVSGTGTAKAASAIAAFATSDAPIVPIVRGSAYVTAEATLLLSDADPFRDGIRGVDSGT
jgi:4-hydroxyproline epimerase